MSKHDIELPLLPRPQVPLTDADIDLMDIHRLASWCEDTAKGYARAAIEPYQRRIAELESQLEAICAGGVGGQPIASQRGGEPVGYARKDQLDKVQRGWSHMCQIQPEPQQGTVAIYTARTGGDGK